MARWDANQVISAYEAAETDRRNLDGQLDLIERYVVPGRGKFYNDDDSEESVDWSAREIYDSTAHNNAQILAANVHGNLTSDSIEWFGLSFEQDELNEDKEAKEWIEDCEIRERKGLQESNFGLEVLETYLDGVTMGTATLLHDEQEGPPLLWNGNRFASQMMRNCYFDEDWEGRPIAVYIMREYSPRQLAVKFGTDALPEDVRKKLEDPVQANEKTEEIIRCIYLDIDKKNVDISRVLSPAARPFVGVYVHIQSESFVGETEGYYEFPGYVLRWQRTAGSKYGYSPAMIALGDILTLQENIQMIRSANEKIVDPPMKSTRRGIIGDLDIQASGLTMVRDMEGLQPLMPPGAYRINTGWQDVADIRRSIDRIFYIDQLQLKESPEMTATEVRVRYELMQRTLGPTLGRIQHDLLKPLVERTFWMMYRKGAFKPMPESVRKAKGTLKIEFKGPLARAMRLQEVDGIMRWLSIGGELSQIPGAEEIIDVPDYDACYEYIGNVLGVPAKLMRSASVRDKKRKARAQDMMNQKQAAALESASGSAKNMAEAKSKMGVQDAAE